MDVPQEDEFIFLTNPSFWDRVKRIDTMTVDGAITLERGQTLPFQKIDLLYYLIFSPDTNKIVLENGEWIEIEVSNNEILQLTTRYRRLFSQQAEFDMSYGNFDISDVIQAEADERLHDIIPMLAKIITGDVAFRHKWILYRACKGSYTASSENEESKTSVQYDDGIASATVVIKLPLEGLPPLDLDFISSVAGSVQSRLPTHYFLDSGPLKFVLSDLRVVDVKLSYSEPPVLGEPYLLTRISSVSVPLSVKAKAIDLTYWETYVEPWLHLPNLLLNRPNPKIVDEILAYWSNVSGLDLHLDMLEKVILNNILADKWNDLVWIGAYRQLLSK